MGNLTRRDALLSTALLGMPERGLASAARTTSEPASRDGVTRSATRVRGFADPEMDFQLLRSLGAASSMGAAVGEVLAAARDITDGEPGTWPPAFVALGDQTRSLARSVLHKHRVSARDHFQRDRAGQPPCSWRYGLRAGRANPSGYMRFGGNSA